MIYIKKYTFLALAIFLTAIFALIIPRSASATHLNFSCFSAEHIDSTCSDSSISSTAFCASTNIVEACVIDSGTGTFFNTACTDCEAFGAGFQCDDTTHGCVAPPTGPTPTPTPIPFCSDHQNCGSCIIGAPGNCGWTGSPTATGSFCQAGTNSCPGTSNWYWLDCITNVCAAAPTSTPTPTPGAPFAIITVQSNSGALVDVTGASTFGGTPPYTFWEWNYGDGTIDSGPTKIDPIGHTYITDGTYTITLKVTDSAAKIGTSSITVTVSSSSTPTPTPAPTVGPGTPTPIPPTPTPAPGCTKSDSNSDGYAETCTDSTGNHTEMCIGSIRRTYDCIASTCVLTEIDCSPNVCTTLLTDQPLCMIALKACFTITASGMSATINADCSTPGPNPITRWVWDFNTDGFSDLEHNSAPGEFPFDYAAFGPVCDSKKYTATLTIYDSANVGATAKNDVTVLGPQPTGFVGTLQCTAVDGNCKCTGVETAIGTISAQPAAFVSRIMSLLLGLAGGIAVLLIILAGYSFMTSRDNPETIQDARQRLLDAIVGLVFIALALAVLEVIGVDVLHIPGFEP